MKIEKNNIDDSIDGMILFQSLKADGNMSVNYGDEEIVLKNKSSFFENINIPFDRTLRFGIKNSDEITHINSEDFFCDGCPSACKLSTDGIITNIKGLFIYLTFGDCIPFIVYDKETGHIGLGHLGRLSICKSLHKKMIGYFADTIGSDISKLTIILGPSIKSPTYNFPSPAQLDIPERSSYVTQLENQNYAINLNAYIVDDLISMGVAKEKIFEHATDTGVDEDFFSHYRSVVKQEEEGRFIFGVGLR